LDVRDVTLNDIDRLPPAQHLSKSNIRPVDRPFLLCTALFDSASPDERSCPAICVPPVTLHRFTRGQFWELAARAAALLKAKGVGAGDCVVHYFPAQSS
jgi:hypothetical protein